MILDNMGNIIHAVNYTVDWYQDAVKSDGGWSLELINPESPCQGASNWIASDNFSGGYFKISDFFILFFRRLFLSVSQSSNFMFDLVFIILILREI